MGETDVTVQTDESLFQGKYKYHRGRLCVVDRTATITCTSHVSTNVESENFDDCKPVYKNY